MPYIKQELRELLNEYVTKPSTPGELNYCFTMILKHYIDQKGFSYTTVNDIVGALECCKLELYRHLAAPYEDTKIKENGDVYDA